MIVTDQPVRWLAVTVFAPFLFWRGSIHNDVTIMLFAMLLFLYDSLWLLLAEPKHMGGSCADRAMKCDS